MASLNGTTHDLKVSRKYSQEGLFMDRVQEMREESR